MDVLLALVIPVGLALLAAAVAFGGRAARAMAIAAFVLAVFSICWVLVRAIA